MTLPALNTDECQAPLEAKSAPSLPIENNLVAAVRSLEAAKAQCEQALFLLQWTPRNAVEVFGSRSKSGLPSLNRGRGGYDSR